MLHESNANDLPVLRNELLALAEALIDQGLRLIPLRRDKKPLWYLLPKVPHEQKDGTIVMKPSWKALLKLGPTTIEDVKHWLDSGASGLAAACGNEFSNGLYVFDIDVATFFDKWVVGEVYEIFMAYQAAFQISGGGGYQVYVIVSGAVPRAQQLAWVPNETKKSGRSIAIETRG